MFADRATSRLGEAAAGSWKDDPERLSSGWRALPWCRRADDVRGSQLRRSVGMGQERSNDSFRTRSLAIAPVDPGG